MKLSPSLGWYRCCAWGIPTFLCTWHGCFIFQVLIETYVYLTVTLLLNLFAACHILMPHLLIRQSETGTVICGTESGPYNCYSWYGYLFQSMRNSLASLPTIICCPFLVTLVSCFYPLNIIQVEMYDILVVDAGTMTHFVKSNQALS